MSTSRHEKPALPITDATTVLQPEPSGQRGAQLPGVMRQINDFNAEGRAHEDLWSRTRRMTDQVAQGTKAASDADSASANAELDHRATQAENPDRTAPRLRQWIVAGGTLALDGVACYFAAEALGGGQSETLVWAGLFLALLGAGEVTLDLYRDSHRVLWRWTACILVTFIMLLGVLRFWFLATVGVEGLVTAGVGATLFTLATGGFVVIGYRALRVAETHAGWRARRKARSSAGAAALAHRKLERLIDKRDALARAYLSLVRTRLVKSCQATELSLMERAIWTHLTDREQS
ncbi:MAG TPA: hypothetical protein VN695_01935 [Streptosporangiaceae bacterium]|nr:hypothetical protein [Streptosporangiaceae bacterium]